LPPLDISKAEPAIEQVELSPPYRLSYTCSEHFEGQLKYIGDARGQDCMVVGGIGADEQGYARPFRTDGKTNEDWYGWGAEVLAPFDAVVTKVHVNPVVNAPGTLGRPPASMIVFQRADGTSVLYAHVTDLRVQVGDAVKAGQPVAKVGNNGFARAPHIHVGAFRGDITLQIRWDLRAMAKLQAGG
jgi:hypothetical protein